MCFVIKSILFTFIFKKHLCKTFLVCAGLDGAVTLDLTNWGGARENAGRVIFFRILQTIVSQATLLGLFRDPLHLYFFGFGRLVKGRNE